MSNSMVKNKKSTKKHSKLVKFLKTSPYSVIVVSAILFLSLVGFVFGYYNFNGQKNLTNDQGVEGDSRTRELIDPSPTPTSSVAKVVTPTPKPTIVQSPQVSLIGPSIRDKDSYVEFTYTTQLNEIANNSYPTISYSINVDGCEFDSLFQTPTRFSGDLEKTDSLSRTFTVSIKSSYLKSKTELRTDPYSLGFGESSIASGVIGVPRCKSTSGNGRYIVEGPGIDKELVEGKYHFAYGFDWEDSLKEDLKEGYTITMYVDCEEWGEGNIESKRTSKNAFSVGGGYAINIDDDAFKGRENLTREGKFEVTSPDGDLIYLGSYQAPNCR